MDKHLTFAEAAKFEPRYDLAAWNEPRIILIDSPYGRRSDVPRLGYVVLPNNSPRY